MGGSVLPVVVTQHNPARVAALVYDKPTVPEGPPLPAAPLSANRLTLEA